MDKIAYTTGTYDLVHKGHFKMLEYIKLRGYNKIIVGLVTDEFAASRKRKPVLSYEHRKCILENSKYNVFVIPCDKSDKLFDYELLKFDALFITDEYYNTEEYNIFSELIGHIPVYYLPREKNDESSSRILTDIVDNITCIDINTININDNIIKIIGLNDIKSYEYIDNIFRNILKLQWYINNTKIMQKCENVWWWFLPCKQSIKSVNLIELNNILISYGIKYNGISFIYI